MTNFSKFPGFAFLICAGLACSESKTFSGTEKATKPGTLKAGVDSKSEPAAAEKAVSASSPESPNAPAYKDITEKFDFVADLSRKADVVWVIDNSGSMAEEADNVRKNFEAFLSTVGAVRDLKIALVSSYGTNGTQMSLPEKYQGQENYTHFKRRVGSTDALTIAAKLSCKPTGTGQYKFCADPDLDAIPIPHTVYTSIEDLQAGEAPLNGMLRSFFREDARRIYIFVSDDNAIGVNETNFIKFIKYDSPADFKPIVYAFRANKSEPQTPGCQGAQDGVAYDSLAKQTGGNVYSVCDEDWSKSFKSLSDSIINISGVSFPLKHQNIAEVTSVTINGAAVPKDKYSVTSGQLSFSEGVVIASASKIEILYKVK